MLTQIINAKILTPQGWLKDGSVLMRANKIFEVANCDLAVIGAELIDAKGMYVVPGGVVPQKGMSSPVKAVASVSCN